MMINPVRRIQCQQELRAIDNSFVDEEVMEEQISSAVMSSFPLTLHTL